MPKSEPETCPHPVDQVGYRHGTFWKLWRCSACSIGCCGVRQMDGDGPEDVECCNCGVLSPEPGT
jgi:hypothetical protein